MNLTQIHSFIISDFPKNYNKKSSLCKGKTLFKKRKMKEYLRK